MENMSYDQYLTGTVSNELGGGFYNVILEDGLTVPTLECSSNFDISVGDSVELVSANTKNNFAI